MIKVVKFGGSSLASAEQFAKVGKIINADKERRYVVPSAPGKRNSKDTKVTDMLYACYDLVEADEDFRVPLMKIKDRYDTIINGLNLKLSLEEEFKKISENFKNKAGVDYAASRGEYLNGIIMANYLGYEFVDAAEVISFEEDGTFDAEKTNKVLADSTGHCRTERSRPFPEAVPTSRDPSWRVRYMPPAMRTGRMCRAFSLQIRASLRIRSRSRRSHTVSCASFPIWAPACFMRTQCSR